MSKNETVKRVFYGTIMVLMFIPQIVTAQYGGLGGKIFASIAYSLIGQVMVYEIITAMKFSKLSAIIVSFAIPGAVILPYASYTNMLETQITIPINVYFRLAFRNWETWLLLFLVSFLPFVMDGIKNHENNLFKFFTIYLSIIMISMVAKMIWALNTRNITIILYFILIPIISDTFGYFGGMLFGKKLFKGKKLAPTISPKKTWAGFVIGALFSIAFVVPYGYYFNIWSSYPHPLAMSIIIGALLCIVAPIGDLFFSYIKRTFGIKDFSNLIPTHGGLMDRFDSLLFVMFLSTIIFII